MSRSRAREFWDERADEHAFYAVDNRIDEQDPDLEGFWRAGREDFDRLLGSVGVDLEPSDEVVEIGCGVGRLTRVISERVASVRALDVSERMLELARGHNPQLDNVDWLLGDGRSLAGVDSDSADVVISHVVFQHIPDPEVTLEYVREIGRVLRPGGWAAFQISNDPSIHRPRTRRGRLRAALRKVMKPWYENRYWLGSHIELPALERAAADGGMGVERVEGEGTQFCIVLTRRLGAGTGG